MVQILAGLITYLLLAIYCREQHNEKVSIKRVRELRIKIQNETRAAKDGTGGPNLKNTRFQKFMQAPNRKLLISFKKISSGFAVSNAKERSDKFAAPCYRYIVLHGTDM